MLWSRESIYQEANPEVSAVSEATQQEEPHGEGESQSLSIQRLEGSRPGYAFSIGFARGTEGVRAAEGGRRKMGMACGAGARG